MEILTKREIIKETNKRILTGLALNGYDIEKPLTIFKGYGKFTINKILKEIEATDKHNIFILLKGFYHNEAKGVSVDASGYYSVEIKTKFEYKLDNFYSKTQFEEVRKLYDLDYYIIKQDKENARQYKNNNKLDIFDRLKMLNFRACTYSNGGRAIREIYFQLPNGKEQYFDVNNASFKYCYCVNSKIRQFEDIGEVIDKSGYLKYLYQERLKEKAKRIKAEKDKQKADNSNFTEETKKAREQAEEIKNAFCQILNRQTTAGKIYELKGVLYKIYNIFDDLERQERRTINKEYLKIETIQNKLNDITKRAEEIKNELNKF